MSLIDHSNHPGITLYSHPNDYLCHGTRLLLAEKKVKYRLILINDDEIEDLAQLNPYASTPTLVDSQVKLFKASIINEYLDDRYRQTRLYADSPHEKSEQRQLLWRIEKDWFKLANITLRHADSLDSKSSLAAKKQLFDTLLSLNPIFQQLPYFMSEQFSIIDCTLAPLLLRLIDLGFELPHPKYKALSLYCKRVFGRESFQVSLTSVEQMQYKAVLQRFTP